MRELQLFIKGERTDLFKDETVSLTQTIQNAKDIGAIFTDFSKSFSLPASAANNKLFKHYYDFEIINGFNANNKAQAEIHLNTFLFRKGFIALDGVSLKDNKPHTYRVTFFGETVDIKKKLQAVTLQNVFEGTSAFNHDYNLTNVLAGLESNVPNITDVIYPLISHTERFYYDEIQNVAGTRNLHYEVNGLGDKNHGVDYTDLKPAMKLTAIIDRITAFTEAQFGAGNGLVFERTGVSFFNVTSGVNYNEVFDKMFLWMSRSKGVLGKDYTGESLTTIVITDMTNPNAGWNPFCYNFNQFLDCENSKITDGLWRIKPVFIQAFNQPSIDFQVEWKVIGSGGGVFSLAVEDITGQTVVVGSATNLSANGTTEYTVTTGFLGTANQVSNIRFVLTATSGTFTYTNKLILKKRFGQEVQNSPIRQYTFEECEIVSVLPAGALDIVVAGDQMPKMLVIDFLTSLFKMFNLTAFVQDDGKIMVQTLNSFYDGGNAIDISDYIDTEAGTVDFAPPYQDIAFRNSPPKTFFATNFQELQGTIYGDLSSSTNVDGVETTDRGNRYVVNTGFEKLLFEKFPDTNIQWGWSVDKDQRPIVTQPLVFINNPTNYFQSAYISFIDGIQSGKASIVEIYNRPSNSLNFGKTINFGAEIDEFTGTVGLQSLFNEQYKRYVSGVFDLNRRLVKITAYLPLDVTLNFSLKDTFIINGKGYKINSIDTDLQTGKSKLELYNNVDF